MSTSLNRIFWFEDGGPHAKAVSKNNTNNTAKRNFKPHLLRKLISIAVNDGDDDEVLSVQHKAKSFLVTNRVVNGSPERQRVTATSTRDLKCE